MDIEGRIRSLNANAEWLLSTTEAKALGRPYTEVFGPSLSQRVFSLVLKAGKSGELKAIEATLPSGRRAKLRDRRYHALTGRGRSGHLGHLESAGLHRDRVRVVDAPVLDDFAVLEPVDRPRLDVLEGCASRGRRDPGQAAHISRAADAADENLVLPSEDVLHLEFPVLEDLHYVLVHHLGPGKALRYTRRPAVGWVVAPEVLVDLLQLP